MPKELRNTQFNNYHKYWISSFVIYEDTNLKKVQKPYGDNDDVSYTDKNQDQIVGR